ncbi:MAG: HDOD domain-containing protein [Planctomycetota bacterium]
MATRNPDRVPSPVGDRGNARNEVWWETPEYLHGLQNPVQPPALSEADRRIVDEVQRRVSEGEFDLTPLPETTTRAMALISNPDVDFADVARLIKVDPILAAEVLKVVNSAVYGGATQIADLDLAVARLGRRPLRSVLLGVSMKLTLKRLPRRELAEALWEHAVACSVMAQRIAREVRATAVDAFLGGLMHDIGMVAVVDAILQAETAQHGTLRPEIVDLVCDDLHESAGLFVAKLWNLPASVVPAITRHHATDPRHLEDPLTAVVALAELLCHALAIGVRRICIDPFTSAPVQALGLDPGRTATVLLAAEHVMRGKLLDLHVAAGAL